MPRPSKTSSTRTRATDVARMAAVSESAVSRTFSGGSVSAHVKARVHAAARELGYRPNAMAQALLTRRSNVIAILMTTNTNSHFPEVLSALSHAIDDAGFRVMLFTVDDQGHVPDIVDQILSYQVDAVLSLTEVPAAEARILADQGVELLLYNRSSESYAVDLVSCDHRAAGFALGRHLVALGHRHFAIIGGPPRSVLATGRADGVLDALAKAGVARDTVPQAEGDFGYDSGRAAAAELLGTREKFTALVCVSDMMAIGAIDEASHRGIAIPEALSVASFDGIGAAHWDRYRLTTMRQPLPQLAHAAVETIKRRLADPRRANEVRLLTCELTQGHSAGPAPA